VGYAVNYKYYEKGERGYDTDEELEFDSKVGEPFEDISLEQLAGAIMAQFARRDVMVFDCTIHELAKKKISFKETKGGIILKNKKYRFDQGAKLHCEDVVQVVPAPPLPAGVMPHEVPVAVPVAVQTTVAPVPQAVPQAVPAPHQTQAQPQSKILNGKPPIRYEVYNPEKYLEDEAKRRKLNFSHGTKYPIYEERNAGNSAAHGIAYVTVDNTGVKQIMHANHFVPEGRGLVGDFSVDQGYTGGDPGSMVALR